MWQVFIVWCFFVSGVFSPATFCVECFRFFFFLSGGLCLAYFFAWCVLSAGVLCLVRCFALGKLLLTAVTTCDCYALASLLTIVTFWLVAGTCYLLIVVCLSLVVSC